MTISYNWINELLPSPLPIEQLSTILTSIGLEVESIEESSAIKGGLKGLVVGKIVDAQKHPNADKLQICMVDVAQEAPIQIVCGAPNAKVGLTVIVALPNTTIYPTMGEPFEIKKGKIRGEESFGMICGEDEIGLGTSHAGIVELPADWQAGALVSNCYNIPTPDFAIEIGLTPNRMDAMSHMGVAKDICAYLGNAKNEMVIQVVPDATLPAAVSAEEIFSIQIKNEEACKRYAGVVINDVTIAASPEWLQQKLKTIGVKPINSIVDITNYVLHECGQPLHAFDAQKINGNQIIIDTANQEKTFTTLDGKERKLQATDLLIQNDTEPMCIAGVFGGEKSGITNSTTKVFLESAWFTPSFIRKTSMHHGLRTDAATRFEKGVDISQTLYGLHRAAKLICELAGGKIVSQVQDVFPTPLPQTKIIVSYDYINKLSGANYSTQKIKNILLQLCFGIEKETEHELHLIVPFAKPDITIPADIVEEIMRIDGLDNIPFTGKISFALSKQEMNTSKKCKEQIATTLVSKGFYELFTNSITSSAHYPQQADSLVKMMNTLSAELDVLRPSMIETGLAAISHNVNRKNTDLFLFEFGKVYQLANAKYIEDEQLCIYISGNTAAENWQQKQKPVDIYFVKSIAEAALQSIGIVAPIEVAEDGGWLIGKKKNKLGQILHVDAIKLKSFDIKQEVFAIVFYWQKLVDLSSNKKIQFSGIPKFPAVRRDLALVLDKTVPYAEVQKCIAAANAKLLQSSNVFDVFESEKLGADKKSYAISLTLADAEKTLTDVEIEADVQKIIASLEKGVGAKIRG